MNSLKRVLGPSSHLAYVLLLALVNVFLYWEYWTGYRLFSGRDFLFLQVPTINFQTDCIRQLSWPLWNPFINFGVPWVDHYLNTALSPDRLFTSLVFGSNVDIVQRASLLWIFCGGVGIYLCAMELGSTRLSAMIAGACFMFSGQLIALPNWNQMIQNACSFPFLLYGYHLSRRKNKWIEYVSLIFLSFFILGGYTPTTVLGFYLLATYVIVDSSMKGSLPFGLKYLAATFTGSLLITLPKLLPLYLAMAAGPRLSGGQGSVPDPYNLLSSYDLLSLLIPVKYFFSVSVGMVCVIGIMYSVIRMRMKLDALFLLAFLSGWLLLANSDGSLSTLRTASYFLPFSRMVRAEWIHWYYPSIFLLLYGARAFDSFLNDERNGARVVSITAYISAVTIAFLWQYDHSQHAKAYGMTVLLAIGWLAARFLYFDVRRPTLFAGLATILLAGESWAQLARIDINEPAVRDRGSIEIRTTDQWNVSHSFRDGVVIGKNKRLRFMADEVRPSVDDSRKRPVLVSAIEAQFHEEMIIDLLNQKRFAGWYNNAQASYEFVDMFYGSELAAMDGRPLFALNVSGDDAARKGVSFDGVSCSGFVFSTTADGASDLLLNQMFDPRWSAYVDGREQRVEKANGHFMEVALSPGRHVVRFVFRDAAFLGSMAVSLLTIAGLVLHAVVGSKRARRSRSRAQAHPTPDAREPRAMDP